METITTLADLIACGDMQGKRIFIRADLNVPLDDAGQITDDTRIRASLPAIRQCLDAGASVMITSHLGRPIEGDPSPRDSLAPVCRRMSALLGRDVRMLANWSGGGFAVPPGQIVMLENCRLNVGESRNSETLARAIASLCDIYVNDAFGTAHRKEATTYGVAQYAPVVCAGPLMAAEIDALHSALDAPRRPLTAIVAGSKVSTKLTILQSLASKVDQLIVGGGIANTFMLAAGLPIGRSLAEPALVEEARRIIDLMQARGAAVPIPEDVVVAKRLAADADARVVDATEVADDDLILDIGPRTAARLERLISAAGTVVWNGPMGVFEIEQFGNGTRALAHAIAESDAFSVAGGGDTLAAIAKYGIEDRIDYISTGGGAFLELLEGKELPALAILAHRTALSMVAPEHEPL